MYIYVIDIMIYYNTNTIAQILHKIAILFPFGNKFYYFAT